MRSALLLLALCACGDELDPNSCRPDGFAEGESMLRGEPFGPFVRAAQLELPPPETGGPAPTHALVFDERPGTCGEIVDSGKRLVLVFCAPPAPGTYRVVSRQVFRCPGDDVLGLVEKDGPADFAEVTNGDLEIEHADGCVRGTYQVQFSGDAIAGMFDAVTCPGSDPT